MKISQVLLLLFLVVLGTNSLEAQEKINQLDQNGKRTGIWKKFYPNQRIRYEGQFENGKEIGIFKFYNAASSIFKTAYYL